VKGAPPPVRRRNLPPLYQSFAAESIKIRRQTIQMWRQNNCLHHRGDKHSPHSNGRPPVHIRRSCRTRRLKHRHDNAKDKEPWRLLRWRNTLRTPRRPLRLRRRSLSFPICVPCQLPQLSAWDCSCRVRSARANACGTRATLRDS